MTIEALPATPPKEASFDKLLSHDDVQIQNAPQTSTTQDHEQPTRVGTAKRRRTLDESFTSLGKKGVLLAGLALVLFLKLTKV